MADDSEFLTPEERANPDADIDPLNVKNVPMDTVANKTLSEVYKDDKLLFNKVRLDVKGIEDQVKKFSQEEQAQAKIKVQMLDLSLENLKQGMGTAVKRNPENAYVIGRQLAMIKREINHWNTKLAEKSTFQQFVAVADALISFMSMSTLAVDNLDVHLGVWEKLQAFIYKIWQATLVIIHAIEDFFNEIWEGLQSIWQDIKNYFASL